MKSSFIFVLGLIFTAQAMGGSAVLCKSEDGLIEFLYQPGGFYMQQLEYSYKGKKIPLSFREYGTSYNGDKKELVIFQQHSTTKRHKLGEKDSQISLKMVEARDKMPDAFSLHTATFKGPKEAVLKIEKEGKVSFEGKLVCDCHVECEEETKKAVDDSSRSVVEKESSRPASAPVKAKGATKH